QESQVSQITSLNQSPPLQRHPKSSKWKWLKTGSTEPESDTGIAPAPAPTTPTIIKPSLIQTTNNPFDPNTSDDELQSKTVFRSERRPSIPLSLFIPESARRGSIKTFDDRTDEQKQLNETHSDINAAFGPHRSVSSQFGEHQLLSSLFDIKTD
ncbi:unnamed protein product, partial [Adineta steineri]